MGTACGKSCKKSGYLEKCYDHQLTHKCVDCQGLFSNITDLKKHKTLCVKFHMPCTDTAIKQIADIVKPVAETLKQIKKVFVVASAKDQKKGGVVQTLEKENQTLKKEKQTLEKENQTLKKEKQTLEKKNQTLEKKNQTIAEIIQNIKIIQEEPALEEPALEEPALEEPALEEPALEEPALEEPALEEPVKKPKRRRKKKQKENGTIQCEHCTLTFVTEGKMVLHRKSVHDTEKEYNCDTCTKGYGRKGCLTRHQTIKHDDTVTHKCEKCQGFFNEKYALERHDDICTGGKKGSGGECRVREALEALGIAHEHDRGYEVKGTGGGDLRWDFRIPKAPGLPVDKMMFIEYNGQQHYKPVGLFGGEEQLSKQKIHDQIKDDFCKLHGYPILWISYTDIARVGELVTAFISKHTDIEVDQIE